MALLLCLFFAVQPIQEEEDVAPGFREASSMRLQVGFRQGSTDLDRSVSRFQCLVRPTRPPQAHSQVVPAVAEQTLVTPWAARHQFLSQSEHFTLHLEGFLHPPLTEVGVCEVHQRPRETESRVRAARAVQLDRSVYLVPGGIRLTVLVRDGRSEVECQGVGAGEICPVAPVRARVLQLLHGDAGLFGRHDVLPRVDQVLHELGPGGRADGDVGALLISCRVRRRTIAAAPSARSPSWPGAGKVATTAARVSVRNRSTWARAMSASFPAVRARCGEVVRIWSRMTPTCGQRPGAADAVRTVIERAIREAGGAGRPSAAPVRTLTSRGAQFAGGCADRACPGMVRARKSSASRSG